MRIWFDADNAPHVPVMRPVAGELRRRGHEVLFTARDRSSTCELLELYGLPYVRVGGRSVKGSAGKALSTLLRALELARAARRFEPSLSFGHGSRSLPVASALLGAPSVTMYDYEWVNPLIFNRFCRAIILPDAVGIDRAAEAGIDPRKVRLFPGLKEQLYLSGRAFGLASAEISRLTGGRPYVLLRPPAVTAHYHNPESEVIFSALLENLASRRDVAVVVIPRSKDDPARAEAAGRGAVVPDAVLDGPDLVWNALLVAGGGGTMTREAAVLGVPAVSFFRGRPGRVDEYLSSLGRLTMLDDADAARSLDPASDQGFSALLENFASRRDVAVVVIPRSKDDPARAEAAGRGAVVPDSVLDGPGLVWNALLVAGGGGTMTREAAVLGVPAVSFFRGRPGRVDEHLASLGRLTMLGEADAARSLDPASFERKLPLENPGLPSRIADTLLG